MPERAGSADAAPLLLASASPRRRWLLDRLGVRFETLAVDLDERPRRDEQPGSFAERLAREKAALAAARQGERSILAADTVVALDDIAFGKPTDAADAGAMLRRLSGRTHTVLTAVVLLRPGGAVAEQITVATRVGFRPLQDAEIAAYVATGEPLDRAGSYAIQGEGAFLVDRVEGSYTNVVGLPLAEIAPWLQSWRRR